MRHVCCQLLVAETRYRPREIGVEGRLQEIYVRSMKRKWTSVSTRGRLTLNAELIGEHAAFRCEVIVHELVHLKLGHGKHNKLFWSLTRAYLAREIASRFSNSSPPAYGRLPQGVGLNLPFVRRFSQRPVNRSAQSSNNPTNPTGSGSRRRRAPFGAGRSRSQPASCAGSGLRRIRWKT